MVTANETRIFRLVAAVLAFVLTSCIGKFPPKPAKVVITYTDAPRREGVPVVLVALPAAEAAKEVLEGLKYEVEEDLDVVTFVVDRKTTLEEFSNAIESVKPSALVLMNNPTLALFYRYQKRVDGKTPPAIALLSSFISGVIDKLENTGGISYEVPAVTLFPSLGDYSRKKISRVGVIHRSALSDFVDRQREMAKLARLELVGEVIRDNPGTKDVQRAVARLRKQNIDAFWVLNDNQLLSAEAYQGWLKGTRSGKRLPVVVGVRPLINHEQPFGTFAILPSHEGLGSQAGEMLLELADEEWSQTISEVQEPIAVEVVVDVAEVRKHFELREDRVGAIDVPVE